MMNIIMLLAFLAMTAHAHAHARSFKLHNDTFLVDGKPLQIMSGSIHYSRVPSIYWRDRLQRLKAMGLNTVQTYVMWNYHETIRGTFDFTGNKDLAHFLQLCKEEDLLVLLRLGPYSCGEWEFGGFPAWMINHNPPVTLRTYEQGYISLVDQWWSKLLPVVKPHLLSNGGNVAMVQVENEFGSYGDVSTNPLDKKYLEHLVDVVHQYLGSDAVQIYTTDGGNTGFMHRGTLNGSIVYTVGDHGPSSDVGNCQAMKQFNAHGQNPCMDSEYYTGWLTHWNDATMANTSTTLVTQWIGDLLNSGGSFNMYMGHGGTSFDFWSGANGNGDGPSYQADITSYGYNAPVGEGGQHGYGSDGLDKYVAIQNVLKQHASPLLSFLVEPPLPPRKAYATIKMSQKAVLLNNLKVLQPLSLSPLSPLLLPLSPLSSMATSSFPVQTTGSSPPSMEDIGQNYGFLVYETTVPTTLQEHVEPKSNNNTIGFSTFPRDRAHVFVDGMIAIDSPLYRSTYNGSVPLTRQHGRTLQVLIENMGRLNYGRGMYDSKGISKDEYLLWNNQRMNNESKWTTWSLPCEREQIYRLKWMDAEEEKTTMTSSSLFTPTFFKGNFSIIGNPADTYIQSKGWTKGSVWVNGNNIGRYWRFGPQHSLYCPANFLNTGVNEVIFLELDHVSNPLLQVEFADTF
jgi:hypothetical protein